LRQNFIEKADLHKETVRILLRRACNSTGKSFKIWLSSVFMKKIIVHGGAGDISKSPHPPTEYKKGVEKAARAGYDALRNGNALDAVVAAVCSLEDNPLFNAGTGSVLNIQGHVETDAMVMFRGSIGAVGALEGIKNPVRVARLVMEETDHILLVGEGAYTFARLYFEECSLITEERKQKFEELRTKFAEGETRWKKNANLFRRHGTVGAVAFDGELAAATSTGGIWLKMKGRVGDSPLVGCGTYAGEKAGISASGAGENIIKSLFSKSVHDLLQKYTLQEALEKALQMTPETGAIAIDSHGTAGYSFNTTHLLWALCDEKECTSFEV
jgi:beta-aspartyl-peptidase (threonine type)